MLNPLLRSRLRDPDYFKLHLEAVAAIRALGPQRWYDAHFVRLVNAARHYLGRVRPDALGTFLDGLDPLRPPANFREMLVEDVFDAETREAVREISRSARLEQSQLQREENQNFGRNVVWNDPFYLDLQVQLLPRVSDLVGRPLKTSYNFLSLYGPEGRCEPHLDHPLAMFTFDYCIDQDEVWPIHVSRVVEWPDRAFAHAFDGDALKADTSLEFATHLLEPGRALIFNGTSQWHYREPKRSGQFCHLLFFHYYPADCEPLVHPLQWAGHFGIPELEPLCDLYDQILSERATDT